MTLREIAASLLGVSSQVAELKALLGDKSALAEIPGLKSQVAALTVDLSTKSAECETLRGQLAAASKVADEKSKELSDAIAASAALKSEVETLKANDKSASAKAREILAGVGVPPIVEPKKAAARETITRSAFNAMSAPDQAHFCRTGGIITD
jgi:chromosome segregation ATPase